MKTLLLSLLTLFSLSNLFAQFEMASVNGILPFDPGPEPTTSKLSIAEPSVATYAYTINDMALISLGSGFKQKINLQVLSPDADLIINQLIEPGQTKVKIDLAGLGDGTYTIRIRVGERTFLRQVVKR